uniref:Axin-2 n=1 Tax=Denticeps clupeoides TaxID=299321 RepID=A0AAY4AEX7_9TELE
MSGALAEPLGGGSFREDAPRPPVPGEEGEASSRKPGRHGRARPTSGAEPARRDEDGLGEPEGSASPDSPPARWTKSLHVLLGDRDGAYLFRTFLEREKCVDVLDFWFACNGFRQMDPKEPKTLRVAKAIYKRYVESHGVVAAQLKPATKTFIRDGVKTQHVDSAMFDQAQTEIQGAMEENAYRMFLASDVYLEFVRAGGENAAYAAGHGGLGGLKLMCGYLPPLIEDKEWSCGDLKAKALATVVGLSAKTLRATVSIRTAAEVLEHGCRTQRRGDPANPYYVNSGHVFAPVTSANDSEISSDAMTDDSMSMTDSSVDGIPPYKLVTKKQLQREMHRSVKINGQVSLPHFPRTHRLPREMTPVEPSAFAAELITRLEKLKREQETMSSLEERLQKIQEQEERDENEAASSTPHHPPHVLGLLPGPCEEDPQAILDNHVSRVLKTPGCQSPGAPLRYSPRSRSPERCATGAPSSLYLGSTSPSYPVPGGKATKHIHHHYIHHHHAGSPKSKEQIEAEAAQRVSQCLCSGGPNYSYQRCHSPAEITQQIADHYSTRSTQGPKKSHANDASSKTLPGRTPSWGGGGVGSHPRNLHPGHPFIQDPAMPPLPPPNTLAQLEEACRRLEEVSKPPKPRHSSSGVQRDRSHQPPFTNGNAPLSSPGLQTDEWKEPKKPNSSHSFTTSSASELVVTYFFCGEEIPYRRMMKTHSLTLGHFKEQLRKKGNYRYYFKKASDEFECGAVFEEVWDDCTVLPMYEGKVLGKVERMD